LSAESVQSPITTRLLAFACFLELIWRLCYERLQMDSHPPARRPHKSPAHTVKDRGTGLSALFRPRHRSARGSRT
jgi:hypothetical protein